MVTVVTKTIGTGGDYTTLQAWEDAAPANLVTADQLWQGQCKNQTFSGSAVMLTMSGSTSDATRYKELTTEAGASFRDNANAQTNALRFNTSNGAAITSSVTYDFTIIMVEDYCRMSNLQIESTASNSQAIHAGGGGSGLSNRISNCIVESKLGCVQMDGDTSVMVNNLLITRGAAVTRIAKFFTTTTVVNCTFVVPSDKTAATSAITVSYASGAVFENCAFFGVADVGTTSGVTYTTCYSDDASPPTGCTNVAYDTSTGSGFQNIADATRDYRIKSTSAMVNTGTTDTIASVDIVGTTRPQGAAYDVSAWEFKASGGITGTFASTLANLVMAAAGTITDIGAFASTLGNLTMSASGTVGSAPSGTFASTLNSFIMSATGTINDTGAFASTLSGISMNAVGTVAPNVTGTFASTLSDVSMLASGFVGTPPVFTGSVSRRHLRPRLISRPQS